MSSTSPGLPDDQEAEVRSREQTAMAAGGNAAAGPGEHEEAPEDSGGVPAGSGRRDFLRSTMWTFACLVIGTYGGAANMPSPQPGRACSPPPQHEVDANCSVGNEVDEGCYTTPSPNPNPPRDPDANCGNNTAQGPDKDNACGDCNDNHDTDQACGQVVSGSLDADEVCGHPHYINGPFYDQDQRCGKAVPGFTGRTSVDQGCGIHDPVYALPVTDTDANCGNIKADGNGDTDSNCYSRASDEHCGANPPPYASDPDEKCNGTQGSYDQDQACGQHGEPNYNNIADVDQSCALDGKDESCGAQDWKFDPDELCSATEIDESCGMMNPGGTIPVNDESCNNTANTDESCHFINGFNPAWNPDEHCGVDGDKDEACNNSGQWNDQDNHCTGEDADESKSDGGDDCAEGGG